MLSETFAPADRCTPVYNTDTKTVTMSKEFKETYQKHGSAFSGVGTKNYWAIHSRYATEEQTADLWRSLAAFSTPW